MTCDGARAAAAGREGRLRLVFRKDSGTVLSEQFAEAPFHAQRAMYCEESLPEMAYLYMMSSSGGILDGDSHRTEITLEEGAMVHLTTQGATRIHGAGPAGARQGVRMDLGRDSYLEFIPDQIIPYRDSRYVQKTSITAHDSATLVYTEVLSSGRLAMAESFQYESCLLETVATGRDGRTRFADVAHIEPKRRDVSAYGVMGGYKVAGSAYVLAPQPYVPGLYGDLNGLASSGEGSTAGGASIMPDGSGVLVRVLGYAAGDVSGMMLSAAALVRRRVLGASFSDIRKS